MKTIQSLGKTVSEVAQKLGLSRPTLSHNWPKNRPELYQTIVDGLQWQGQNYLTPGAFAEAYALSHIMSLHGCDISKAISMKANQVKVRRHYEELESQALELFRQYKLIQHAASKAGEA